MRKRTLLYLFVFLSFSGKVFADGPRSLVLNEASSQYAGISDGSQTGLDITGNFTIEAWIKLKSLPSDTGHNYAIATKFANSQFGIQFYVNVSNKLELYYTDALDGSTYTQSYGTTVFGADDLNIWVHVAVTAVVSTQTIKFYVNGVDDPSTTPASSASSMINNSADFRIGSRAYDYEYFFFDGKLAEVRIWNLVRTSNQIHDNYNVELTGSESGLQGYWKLANGYQDSTANANDLTPGGSPVFSIDVPSFLVVP